MRWCPFGVARVADIAKDSSLRNDLARCDRSEPFEVCVVMPFSTRAEHPHDAAAETVRAYGCNDPRGRTEDRSLAPRKDVDAAMTAASGSRAVPRVAETSR